MNLRSFMRVCMVGCLVNGKRVDESLLSEYGDKIIRKINTSMGRMNLDLVLGDKSEENSKVFVKDLVEVMEKGDLWIKNERFVSNEFIGKEVKGVYTLGNGLVMVEVYY